MLLTIIVCTAATALFLIYQSLGEQKKHYSDLTLNDIGAKIGEALLPGIVSGIVVVVVMTNFFPVKKVGHPFAPFYGADLIYKVRIQTTNGRETIGNAYIHYYRGAGEDDCIIEVRKLVFGGRTYEIDSDEGCCYYCLFGIGKWNELALVGHSNVRAMLLDEKVGEH